MSVCHSVHGGGGGHVTITHNALDLTVQGCTAMPPGHQTWKPQPQPWPSLLVTSGGHHWTPVQASSFEDLPEPHLVLAIEAPYGWRKRAVRILLECFTVHIIY